MADEVKGFRSKYGPRYKVAPNFHGLTLNKFITNYGISAGLFGGVAGIALLFFASDVPRVRADILQKVPIVGGYFKREVAPEDNPF